jgi:hypothetical protein
MTVLTFSARMTFHDCLKSSQNTLKQPVSTLKAGIPGFFETSITTELKASGHRRRLVDAIKPVKAQKLLARCSTGSRLQGAACGRHKLHFNDDGRWRFGNRWRFDNSPSRRKGLAIRLDFSEPTDTKYYVSLLYEHTATWHYVCDVCHSVRLFDLFVAADAKEVSG